MIIETSDYILEQLSEHSIHWDLTFPKIVNKGKENERIEFKDPIYAIPIENAKKRIALWRVNKAIGDKTKKISPEQFNILYSKEIEKINKELINV